ncbi:MAG TPA: Sir2 family NAD-dependent protein deacetylase [Bacteroidales bacterium]|jgi:NAD-dependent deacetylase|nr:NAD-dependent deacylase [Bacteroidales bacterium]HOF15719.1 Sir2 family NAD-dependent protein deacetylase [Bacteroidales bacterium]HOR81180.1 Sir2 family NAD-dependent protein deacetylase [Bacteroidales bacterium]HPJ90447.1 Sir2 family NAD-dependent protein deacetylase [Bacteroidales bacterium]HPX58965.1 Sir2 family NAD-dependent protein deacetylase [Bacteroidales bacterium]
MKKIVVLTGAGISAESGIKTFRDSDGLWENYRVEDVATPEAWENNYELVLNFYNERLQQLDKAFPNDGHNYLTKLESHYEVQIITQNVDDLHEKAGSSNVLHLHGELRKKRSQVNPDYILEIDKTENQIKKGDLCPWGQQMRPHIVWFGEAVPLIEEAAKLVEQADIFIIIGTSMAVYPAAGLIYYVKPGIPIYYIDPKANETPNVSKNTIRIAEKASIGVAQLVNELLEKAKNAN